MTTSSDRILLRWVPLAAILAAAASVGLTVGPDPFSYHEWPQPTAQRPIARLVRSTSPSPPADFPGRSRIVLVRRAAAIAHAPPARTRGIHSAAPHGTTARGSSAGSSGRRGAPQGPRTSARGDRSAHPSQVDAGASGKPGAGAPRPPSVTPPARLAGL